jgi:hypothetical protein
MSELKQQLQQPPVSFGGNNPAGFGGNSLPGWLFRLRWDLLAQVKDGRTTGVVAVVIAVMAKNLSQLLHKHNPAAAAGAASILPGSSSSSRELQLEVCEKFQRALWELSQQLVVLPGGDTPVGEVVQGWVGTMRGRLTAAAAAAADADALVLQLAEVL